MSIHSKNIPLRIFTDSQKPLTGANIILDRDGTIIEDRHYLSNPEEIFLLPGVIEGLGLLYKLGAKLFIVTNQSGLGRGLFNIDQYHACETKLKDLLQQQEIEITYTAFCPHTPEDRCLCRKPQTGLWEEIATKFKLNPNYSIMLGDKFTDFQFGLNCRLAASILLLNSSKKELAKENLSQFPTLTQYLKTNPLKFYSQQESIVINLDDKPQKTIKLIVNNFYTAVLWIAKTWLPSIKNNLQTIATNTNLEIKKQV